MPPLPNEYFLDKRMESIHAARMNPIVEKYLMLVEKISNTTKTFKSFGTDVNIYRSEIHVIQLIGDRKNVHLSEIARLIGITKGTVSQIAKRLEGKGLVEKHVDENNNTRRLVRLTEKGKIACKAHVRYHLRKHSEMENYLKSLTDEQKEVVKEFLNKAHDMIEDHL